ncbi:MAG: YggS family pyridoxal phosphate-dependent enzyme [Crocinitomicaceae bacterium]|nr:YggS family pyridoxal phosphate-dependent enzyme [Crocinitomicaceae bacterium]
MIAERIQQLKNELPENVQLIAVSKTKPNADIQVAYDAGQRVFGENKVQELADKYKALPKDIEWHLIGHLQTNKVKYIAPFVHLIHAVDSLKLLQEINKQALKNDRVINCLLQFFIASEDTKFGFSIEEAQDMLSSPAFFELKNIKIVGVMGMASFVDDEGQVEKEFKNLHSYFQLLKSSVFESNADFKEISMGMSGDYKIAIAQGSTMVRLGSTIFGNR